MKLGILFIILFYYGILSTIIYAPDSPFLNSASVNAPLDTAALNAGEMQEGGLFSAGVSFIRFFGLVAFGVGLPAETPLFFSFIFAIWQSCVTLGTIAFILSSIWNG